MLRIISALRTPGSFKGGVYVYAVLAKHQVLAHLYLWDQFDLNPRHTPLSVRQVSMPGRDCLHTKLNALGTWPGILSEYSSSYVGFQFYT